MRELFTGLTAQLKKAGVLLLAALLLSLLASGCVLSGPASLRSTAYFKDVGNLASGAPVELAGVNVGSVSSITLSGTKAKVVMSLRKSAGVPVDVKAEATQSTVLGEEVVQLIVEKHASARLLSNDSVIKESSLVPGIQQFVEGGTAVLGAVGTSQLAEIVNAGGEGFGGEGAELRSLIADLGDAMAGYASHDRQIRTLVTSMSRLSASLAPKASSDAEALSNLSRSVKVIDEQRQDLVSLLESLHGLSLEGRSILDEELSGIDYQLKSLAGVASTVNGQQGAIRELLHQLPLHDATMHNVTVDHFAQIIDSIIVCGLPDGGSSSQAASSCHGAGALPTGSKP